MSHVTIIGSHQDARERWHLCDGKCMEINSWSLFSGSYRAAGLPPRPKVLGSVEAHTLPKVKSGWSTKPRTPTGNWTEKMLSTSISSPPWSVLIACKHLSLIWEPKEGHYEDHAHEPALVSALLQQWLAPFCPFLPLPNSMSSVISSLLELPIAASRNQKIKLPTWKSKQLQDADKFLNSYKMLTSF